MNPPLRALAGVSRVCAWALENLPTQRPLSS